MKATTTPASIALLVLIFLVGIFTGGAAVYMMTMRSVELACGGDNFIVPKMYVTNELRSSCKQLAELADTMQMRNQAEDVSSPWLHCDAVRSSELGHGTVSVTIGTAKVDGSHVDTFNVLCEKYKQRFNQLPQVTLDGSAGNNEKYHQRLISEQQISTEFRAQSSGFSQGSSKQEASFQGIQQARREMRRKVIEANGGYKIMRDRDGIIVISNPQ